MKMLTWKRTTNMLIGVLNQLGLLTLSFGFSFDCYFGRSVAEASQVKNELFPATRLIIKPDPQGQIQGQFSSDLQPVFNLKPWLVIRTFILRFCRTWTSQKCQVIRIRSRWDKLFSGWRPVIAFLYCFPFHSFLHCYNTRPLVGVEPHRPPMTNVGPETAFRLDHCKHFQKANISWGQRSVDAIICLHRPQKKHSPRSEFMPELQRWILKLTALMTIIDLIVMKTLLPTRDCLWLCQACKRGRKPTERNFRQDAHSYPQADICWAPYSDHDDTHLIIDNRQWST